MIEKDYDVSFVAAIALREKQIQQNYRPVIAVHKWFARGRVPIFPIKLPAEHGVKWPFVSTSSTDPLCSRTAIGVWPRHWRDTKRDRVLSSGD